MPKDLAETPEGREALLSLAAECVAKNTSSEEAAAELLRRVGTRGHLYKALIGPYVRIAARELVEAVTRKARKSMWSAAARAPAPAAQSPAAQVARASAASRAVAAALLDFPLPGGRPLRLATRAQVAEAAKRYRAQASDMAWKARWLDRIAAALPDDDTAVANHLDNAALFQLRQEASK